MTRPPYAALAPLAAATVCLLAACSRLPFGVRPVEPAPVAEVAPEPRAPWEAPSSAATAPSDEDGVTRLVRLAEVWHAVRWFHPEVADRAGAWDTAYLRHVDRARSAGDAAAFARAVQVMLDELADADTRVVGDTTAPLGTPRGLAAGALLLTPDSLVVARPVQIGPDGDLQAVRTQLGGQVPRTVAVLDLRADSGRVRDAAWRARAPNDAEFPLPDGTLDRPARRRLTHAGPGDANGSAASTWSLTTGPRVQAETPASASTDTALARVVAPLRARDPYRPPVLVVIVNDATIVPAPLFTLHAEGQAVFVSTGSGVLRSDAQAVHVPLGGGFHARIRTEELLRPDGRAVPARADTVLTSDGVASALVPDTSDQATALALAIARGSVRVPVRMPSPRLAASAAVGASPAGGAPYPPHPERLLAVTQLWGTVRAFNPYLPMADESWDEAFTRTLPDIERATSAREYAAALFRFAATLDASQVDITASDHPEFGRRTGFAPLRLHLVDRRPIVIEIADSASARTGVRVGDEVLAIGGEPIDKRLGRWRELMPASNAWSRDQRFVSWLESGPALVKATFRMRAQTGTISEVEFMYGVSVAVDAPRAAIRTIDTLTGGVVHVRLGAAPNNASALLPADLARAPAVIVDARGVRSSESLAWLAGSVLDADARAWARDEYSTLVAPPGGSLRTPELDPARQFTRTARMTPPAPREPFTGPMAILVDATTSGDGELLALRLASGPGRVLVGTSTAGAVGRTSTIALAGGIRVTFPVSDVRHPDGRFIQRLGLAPQIMATPTVEGARRGRDEILEAAQRWITQQLAPPPPLPVRRR